MLHLTADGKQPAYRLQVSVDEDQRRRAVCVGPCCLFRAAECFRLSLAIRLYLLQRPYWPFYNFLKLALHGSPTLRGSIFHVFPEITFMTGYACFKIICDELD